MYLFFNYIAVCTTRKVKKKKRITVTINEGYFHFFSQD